MAPSRLILILLLLWGIAAPTTTADPIQSQVSAAKANAVDQLLSNVMEERIGIDLTVRQFIDRTSGLSPLQVVLADAEQVGGTRWLDDKTCQIKLAIPRERVIEVLTQLAELRPSDAPLPPEAIVKQLKDWRGKTFVATGVALSLERARQLAPPSDALAWQNISEQTRQQAITQAARNAADRTLDAIKSVEVEPGHPLSVVLDKQDVREKLLDSFSAQPVTSVQFRDDLSVETTLRPQTDDVVTTLINTLQAASIDVPDDSTEVQRFRDSIDRQLGRSVGRAKAADQKPSNRIVFRQLFSADPPEWTRRRIEIAATAPAGDSRLKTARQAEDTALGMLRSRIEALTVSGSTTIGALAKENRDVSRIVDDMMMRARVVKVDYLPDGSASVQLSFDPRDLWDELRQLP